jgi:hypothetical protein
MQRLDFKAAGGRASGFSIAVAIPSSTRLKLLLETVKRSSPSPN